MSERGTYLLYQVNTSRSLTGDGIQGIFLLHEIADISDVDSHLKVTWIKQKFDYDFWSQFEKRVLVNDGIF